MRPGAPRARHKGAVMYRSFARRDPARIRKSPFNSRVFTRAVLCACAPLLFAACVHWPDVSTECSLYGVAENQRPLGHIVVAKAVFHDELYARCGEIARDSLKINAAGTIAGCVVPHPDGTVYAYYRVGDRCALNHELCHALHGIEHTGRYLEDLTRGAAAPYCPPNPFSGRASAG